MCLIFKNWKKILYILSLNYSYRNKLATGKTYIRLHYFTLAGPYPFSHCDRLNYLVQVFLKKGVPAAGLTRVLFIRYACASIEMINQVVSSTISSSHIYIFIFIRVGQERGHTAAARTMDGLLRSVPSHQRTPDFLREKCASKRKYIASWLLLI